MLIRSQPYALGIAALWAVSSPTPFRAHGEATAALPLVVVSAGLDVGCVQRLGEGVVEVQPLLPGFTAATLRNYFLCNAHVLQLQSYRGLLRGPELCEFELLWFERLHQANPHGHVVTVNARSAPARAYREFRQEGVREIHAALCGLVPEQKPRLDANLRWQLECLEDTRIELARTGSRPTILFLAETRRGGDQPCQD